MSWDIAVAVAFAVGVLLFGISSAMLRSARSEPRLSAPMIEAAEPQAPEWPELVDPDLRDAAEDLRLDIIERLSILGTPWSREILERARNEERDPSILAAIDRAL